MWHYPPVRRAYRSKRLCKGESDDHAEIIVDKGTFIYHGYDIIALRLVEKICTGTLIAIGLYVIVFYLIPAVKNFLQSVQSFN